MKTIDCQALLTGTLSRTRIPIPVDTPFHVTAALILEMARAYERDGITFLASGDPVNALAGFYYGFGWLHVGLASGLLAGMDTAACPFTGQSEKLPPEFRAKLEEKSHRYDRLLDTARNSVECAPDPATANHEFAMRVLFTAGIYNNQGRHLLQSGAYEGALACFSYGHGWLDGGVAAGLFRVTAHRDIFCV